MSGQGQQKGGQGQMGTPQISDMSYKLPPGQGFGIPGEGFFSMGHSMRAPFGTAAAPGTGVPPPGSGGGLTGGTGPIVPGAGGLLGGPGGLTGGSAAGVNPLSGSGPFFGSSSFGPAMSSSPLSGPWFGSGLTGGGLSGATGGMSGTPSSQPLGTTYGGVAAPPPTTDPSSPEYAAWYNSLAPSTRAFLAPPGSPQASSMYGSYMASTGDPTQAHF